MGLLALKKNFLIRENKSENDIKNVKIKNSNELIYGNEVKNKYCIKINELINSTGMPKFPFVGYTKTKDFEFSLNGQNKDAQYLKGENLKTQTSLVKNSINYEKFSGLSEENRIINFRNFNWSLFRNQKCYGAIENAYKEALSYSRFKTGFNNLLIKGNVGAGKTFISICITNEAIKNEKNVYYINSYTLFENIRKMKVLNEVSSIKIYTKVYKCELLIIDDLGCEKVSPFVVAEFLNLINNRSVTNFKTLINTNLNESRLLEKYGQRITSRLLGTSKIINFPGKDLRMLTKMAVS